MVFGMGTCPSPHQATLQLSGHTISSELDGSDFPPMQLPLTHRVLALHGDEWGLLHMLVKQKDA